MACNAAPCGWRPARAWSACRWRRLHNGCQAESHLTLELASGAELKGWDVTALGLPHADQAFPNGRFCQHIELPGVWLEHGVLDAADTRLLTSPLGLAGHACMASLFFATASPLGRERRALALDTARHILAWHALQATAGATSPNPQVVLLRVLAPQVELAMGLLRGVWAAWRQALSALPAVPPRIWAT